jgi:hypothetical protein
MLRIAVRRLGALALLLGSSLPPASAAGPPPPPLNELLDRAGRYVSDLEERLAIVLGDETYGQSLFVGRGSAVDPPVDRFRRGVGPHRGPDGLGLLP